MKRPSSEPRSVNETPKRVACQGLVGFMTLLPNVVLENFGDLARHPAPSCELRATAGKPQDSCKNSR